MLSPAEGPRALLRARLAIEAQGGRSSRMQWLPIATAVCAILAALLTFEATRNVTSPLPKASITPGEAQPISLDEVCSRADAEVIRRGIPENIQRAVFTAYGIRSPQPGQYEIDYLITPDLGGAESTRNLWPEPYSTRWNARLKDALEQRLHQLVCARTVDLATAQHDIATDWIAAYRKYVSPK
ncbi:MAG TPA: hypothetical protein VKB79_09080 [Bryobacteraceae bacterium]|nr:hypothetical protein [Bryobacteraceae bacterium]